MTPSLLLDTHALLWWLVEPEQLSSFALVCRPGDTRAKSL